MNKMKSLHFVLYSPAIFELINRINPLVWLCFIATILHSLPFVHSFPIDLLNKGSQLMVEREVLLSIDISPVFIWAGHSPLHRGESIYLLLNSSNQWLNDTSRYLTYLGRDLQKNFKYQVGFQNKCILTKHINLAAGWLIGHIKAKLWHVMYLENRLSHKKCIGL